MRARQARRGSLTRQEKYNQEMERHRETLKVRRRGSLDNTLDSDNGGGIGAQIAAAGAIHEDEDDGEVEEEQLVVMQRILKAMGTFIVKFKFWVIAFYTIVCIIFIYQATNLKPSDEGPVKKKTPQNKPKINLWTQNVL